MVEAKLFELQVSLNSSGQVITEFNYIERDNLVTALDGWRKDYPNTHVLGSIVHFGDWLSTICEKQTWLQGEEEHQEEHIVHKKSSDKDIKNMKAKFDELFN